MTTSILPSDVASWPELSYHYHLGWNDLVEMPRWARELYADRLDLLLARDDLRLITVSSYPHMTDEGREEARKDIKERAGFIDAQAAEVPTSPAVVQRLAGMGIKVVGR